MITPPVLPSNNAFGYAWYFAMVEDVGAHWTLASESDPEVVNGLIETTAQRRKVGYVNIKDFPGGETKFGVPQRPNPTKVIRTITYVEAQQIGFDAYWAGAPAPCTGTLLTDATLVSVMLFDINFMHGTSSGKTIYENAGLTFSGLQSQIEQQALCEQLNAARLAFINQLARPSDLFNWTSRANACLEYCLSLPPLTPP